MGKVEFGVIYPLLCSLVLYMGSGSCIYTFVCSVAIRRHRPMQKCLPFRPFCRPLMQTSNTLACESFSSPFLIQTDSFVALGDDLPDVHHLGLPVLSRLTLDVAWYDDVVFGRAVQVPTSQCCGCGSDPCFVE